MTKMMIYCLIQAMIGIKTKSIILKNLIIYPSLRSSSIKETTTTIVASDPLLLQKKIKYEKQPNIYTHQPQTQENDNKRSFTIIC